MPAIKPSEVTVWREKSIPEFVFDAFNKLIVDNFSGGEATVKQEDVIAIIKLSQPDIRRDAIFANNWLEVEPVYRKAGWKVVYDKPGFNESYEAFFIFKI